MRLSYSLFTNCMQCPLRVLLLSTVVDKQPLFKEQAAGLYAHACLQNTIAEAYGKPQVDPWGFLDEDRELVMEKDQYKFFVTDKYGTMIENAKDAVLGVLKSDGVFDVEIEKEFTISEGVYDLVGRPDIIGHTDDGVIIYDLKRSNSNSYDDKQLSLYAYILEQHGYKVKSIKLIFIRDKLKVTSFPPNIGSAEFVLSKLNEIANAFLNDDFSFFRPNPFTRTCALDRCAAFMVCPHGAIKEHLSEI